jgi:hypothetical protein
MRAAASATHLERFVKFLLWCAAAGACSSMDRRRSSPGSPRTTATPPPDASTRPRVRADVRSSLEVVHTRDLPAGAPRRDRSDAISRAAGSASTLAAIEGGGGDRRRVVFSDETVWDPYHEPDPHHVDGIMDCWRRPPPPPGVDAIGGSAAGV